MNGVQYLESQLSNQLGTRSIYLPDVEIGDIAFKILITIQLLCGRGFVLEILFSADHERTLSLIGCCKISGLKF